MIAKAVARAVLPIVCSWVRRHERAILARGVPLGAPQLADARLVGVVEPERVRVLVVPTIPPQLPRSLRHFAARLGLGPATTIGIALGHGIYLRAGLERSRELLVHELAHVAQYERLGFRAFLARYVRECLSCGYPAGELEREAQQIAARFRC